MKELAERWIKKGWAAPWEARIGCFPERGSKESDIEDGEKPSDFFGIPSLCHKEDVYIGVGGMHLLPRKILESSNAIVHKGTRVSGVSSRDIESSDEKVRIVFDKFQHLLFTGYKPFNIFTANTSYRLYKNSTATKVY